MEFPVVLNKGHVEISGIDYKKSGISRSDYEKLLWNFHWFWVLTLVFRRSV